jgi:hypothetical protein
VKARTLVTDADAVHRDPRVGGQRGSSSIDAETHPRGQAPSAQQRAEHEALSQTRAAPRERSIRGCSKSRQARSGGSVDVRLITMASDTLLNREDGRQRQDAQGDLDHDREHARFDQRHDIG